MSIKDMIRSWLNKPQEEADLTAPAEEAGAPSPANQPDPALLQLPSDHPIHRMCLLYREQTGEIATPLLHLDSQGLVHPDNLQRELGRLKQGVASICFNRLEKSIPKDIESPTPELDALPWFFLSADKLAAWVLVFPPVGEGKPLDKELLQQALESQGITYGVDDALVSRLPQAEDRYFHLFLIAKGTPPVNGEDGQIKDFFPRSLQHVFSVDDNDHADYTSLNLIQNVEPGDTICQLTPPTEGEPGWTVLDEEVPARDGKAVSLPKGRNTEISEDGLLLLASQAGHVEFTGRSFQVKPVMNIGGNVDYSTGNINFLGDVHIKGDICGGFTVRAMGSIQVEGVIEPGSTVEAGGDLVVAKGILGSEDTIIRAQRSVFAKYMENVTIYARENLETECIINCNIYSDGEVRVLERRGTIIGGQVWAARQISANIIGAKSERRTSLHLGGQPCTNFEAEVLRHELQEMKDEIVKLAQQPESPKKFSSMGKIRMKLSVNQLKLEQLERDLAEARDAEAENDRRRLECGLAYPGTEIFIGEQSLLLKHEYRQCVAKLQEGEITIA